MLIDSLILNNQKNLYLDIAKSQTNHDSKTFEETIIAWGLECHEMDWYCYYDFYLEEDPDGLKI